MATFRHTKSTIDASLVNCPVKLTILEKSVIKTYLNCNGFDDETPIIFVDKMNCLKFRLVLAISQMSLFQKNPEYQGVGEPIFYVRLKDFKLKYKDD